MGLLHHSSAEQPALVMTITMTESLVNQVQDPQQMIACSPSKHTLKLCEMERYPIVMWQLGITKIEGPSEYVPDGRLVFPLVYLIESTNECQY